MTYFQSCHFFKGSVRINEKDSVFTNFFKNILESINFYEEKYKLSKNELILASKYLNPKFKRIKRDDRKRQKRKIIKKKMKQFIDIII